MEIWVAENGVFKGEELSPVLIKSYITYAESLRRDLLTLGIKRRAGNRAFDVTSYIADFDKRARDAQKAKEGEDGSK